MIPDGTYGVLLTPFNECGKIEEELFREELNVCSATKTAGLFPCGSTGEFVYMNMEQKMSALRITAEMAGDKVLIGGVGAPTEEQTLELLRYIKNIGYEYAMVCPPYYYPQKPQDILRYYTYISKKAPEDLTLLIYNIPFCTAEIYLSVLPQIMDLPNVGGMKDSSGNMVYMAHVISIAEEKNKEFSVFTGQDCSLLPSLAAGARGCMSALSWLTDRPVADICEAFRNGNIEKAVQLQKSVNLLVRHLDAVSFPENYRMLARALGLKMGVPQRHLQNLNEEFYSRWAEKARYYMAGV